MRCSRKLPLSAEFFCLPTRIVVVRPCDRISQQTKAPSRASSSDHRAQNNKISTTRSHNQHIYSNHAENRDTNTNIYTSTTTQQHHIMASLCYAAPLLWRHSAVWRHRSTTTKNTPITNSQRNRTEQRRHSWLHALVSSPTSSRVCDWCL